MAGRASEVVDARNSGMETVSSTPRRARSVRVRKRRWTGTCRPCELWD